MTRVLYLGLVGGVAFLLGHFLQPRIPLAGAAGGGTMLVSGDANGDGIVDIADAVCIIDYQLRGGPTPVPIECPLAALPATGQTKCYDNDGNVIDCTSTDFPGQDGFYQAGCSTEGRFVDNGDGTVTDTCTGLMWQKETGDVSGNGSIGQYTEDAVDWQEALKYCDGLDFAGHVDWRLPNVRELQSIVDHGRGEPSIDPVFRAHSTWYWSSSSYADAPLSAWNVCFAGVVAAGSTGVDAKLGLHHVRAVREAP